jgi:hypothetical protein
MLMAAAQGRYSTAVMQVSPSSAVSQHARVARCSNHRCQCRCHASEYARQAVQVTQSTQRTNPPACYMSTSSCLLLSTTGSSSLTCCRGEAARWHCQLQPAQMPLLLPSLRECQAGRAGYSVNITRLLSCFKGQHALVCCFQRLP